MLTLFVVVFSFILYPVIESMEAGQTIDSGIEYRCGYKIFTDQKIKEALRAAQYSLKMGNSFPAPFKDSLYGDKLGYLVWPIKSHGELFRIKSDAPGPHLIVMNTSKEFLDVIVRLSDQSYIKCLKYDPSRSDVSETTLKDSNGYQCGSIFFSDKSTLAARDFAMKKLGKVGVRYPQLIKDPQYDSKLKYNIWPIRYTGRAYINGLENGGPFYIVFDPNGKVVDVVARATDNSFIKCFRARKVGSASPLEPGGELFVPAPISGFQCGRVFFKEDYVKKASTIAAEIARSIEKPYSRKKVRLLEKYGKEPYPPGSYLWPLSASHKQHMTGNPGIYRAVLSSEFEILGVIIYKNDMIYDCQKVIIKGKKNHDKNDYTCLDIDFSHEELLLAAENGCKKLNIINIKFPAIYDGPEFDNEGPYMTYPVLKQRSFGLSSGKYRVVMNYKCEIVGALFKVGDNFFKCLKKVSGVTVELYLDGNEPLIREIYH